jgi:glycosyltransferase 2 family protein
LLLLIFTMRILFKKYNSNKIIIKAKEILANIKSGLKTIFTLKRKKEFLLHTLIIWAMYLLEIYAAFFAFEQTNGLSISVACVALTAGTLGMIATPNGIGSFPLLVGGALVLYGVEKEMGITFGWIMWAVMTGITLIFGVLSFILLPRLNKNNEQSTVTL